MAAVISAVKAWCSDFAILIRKRQVVLLAILLFALVVVIAPDAVVMIPGYVCLWFVCLIASHVLLGMVE